MYTKGTRSKSRYKKLCHIMIALWGWLALTIAFRALTGSSIATAFVSLSDTLSAWPTVQAMNKESFLYGCVFVLGLFCELISGLSRFILSITNLEAVLSISQTVGFSSVLIVWVYSSFDKEQLGFRYSELLQELYPNYNLFVLSHFCSVVSAIGLSKAKYLESAIVSLIILLLGCALQWKALENLILFEDKREKIACDKWQWELDSSRPTANNTNVTDGAAEKERYHSRLLSIAHVISGCGDKHSGRLEDLFARDFSLFFIVCGGGAGQPEHYEATLHKLSEIWAALLEGKPQSERIRQSVYMFNKFPDGETLTPLSLSYAAWLHGMYYEIYAKDTSPHIEGMLETMCNELQLMRSHDVKQHNAVFGCLSASLLLLIWIYLWKGEIGFSHILFFDSPEVSATERPLFEAFCAECFRNNSIDQKLFDISFSRICSSTNREMRYGKRY